MTRAQILSAVPRWKLTWSQKMEIQSRRAAAERQFDDPEFVLTLTADLDAEDPLWGERMLAAMKRDEDAAEVATQYMEEVFID